MDQSFNFEKDKELTVQIETINYCNRSCMYCFWGYCNPQKPAIMSLDLFERILIELTKLKRPIKIVSFAAYNEPTIDPFFIKRLDLLKKYNLKYWNITNGINLNAKITDYFMNNLDLIYKFVCIDLPALSYEAIHKLTNCSVAQYRRLMKNIENYGHCIEKNKLNAVITVLGWNDEFHEKNLDEVKEKFAKYGYNIIKGFLCDRAGQLKPHIDNKFYLENPRQCNCGGDRINDFLHFGVKGNLYICCQDFHQRYSYGNILQKQLPEILDSEERIHSIRGILSDLCKHCCYAK